MSAEVTLRPLPSSFPRPTSLYMPDLSASTQSLISTSSYSPFPTIPGSNRDPHGLDQFLLPPDHPSWSYANLAPADTTLPLQLTPQPAASPSTQPTRESLGLKKVRSFSMLGRSSPLSQPPVSAGQEAHEARTRQRSNSVDSVPSPILETPTDQLPPSGSLPEIAAEKKSGAKQSIRQAFQFRRKSVLSMMDLAANAESSPSSAPLSTPSISTASSDDVDLTTPMSSRSNSNISEISSGSSSSSSEGVKTPSEVVPQSEVELAGGKLAVALAAAGDKRNKKGSWRGWLGGKRSTKNDADSDSSSPSDRSAESSPNGSSVSLNVIPSVTLTPSPDIVTPSRAASIVSSTERHANRAVTMEQVRRLSFAKLNQLRSPSPHPLALSLRRQYSNLPDEIATSIRSGQKVFPMSTNVYDSRSGLKPMQGGLLNALTVKAVLVKLDQGDCPETSLLSRSPTNPVILPRPRGVSDFIDRPPFEERNIVFYPNGTCSPISMARPGYGVWDLDFSPYLYALAKVDSSPAAPWPMLPRPSLGPTLEGCDDVLADMPEPQTSPESEAEEVLVSPLPEIKPLEDEVVVKVASSEESLSSFRPAKSTTSSCEESSDEEEAEEEEDDDDSPLARIYSKRDQSLVSVAPTLQKPAIRHERAPSNPSKRVSIAVVNDEEKKRKIMDEVARARERRSANLSGEAERRAEAERHQRRPAQAPSYKRSSTMDLSNSNRRDSHLSASTGNVPSVKVSAASPSSNPREARRRTKSSYEIHESARPAASRTPSAPEGVPSRRSNSFYGLQAGSMQQFPMYPPAPAFPLPVYAQPGMQAYPAMSPQPSMIFPQHGYVQPMPMSPQNAALYLQMQGRSSRSSLVVPSPSRPSASHRPSSTYHPTSTRTKRSSHVA